MYVDRREEFIFLAIFPSPFSTFSTSLYFTLSRSILILLNSPKGKATRPEESRESGVYCVLGAVAHSFSRNILECPPRIGLVKNSIHCRRT